VSTELVSAYFDAINGDDFDAAAQLFAPTAELLAPGTAPRRGHAQIADYLRAALAPYPEHIDEPTRVILAGDTAVAEIRFTGVLASGGRVAFDAVDVFDFDAGHIARLSSWYDSHAVRTALRAARDAAGDRPARMRESS
jgi:uncharacterized protein (TIGR02246 family)